MRETIQALGFKSTAHGLRSSFQTWADENLDLGRYYNAVQACLHHGQAGKKHNGERVGSEVSAYRKSDWFDLRREVLEKWSKFLLGI